MNNTNPSSFDGLMQESDNIISLDPFALEALSPVGKDGLVKSLLTAWETECESQWQLFVHQFMIFHEFKDALCYMVK